MDQNTAGETVGESTDAAARDAAAPAVAGPPANSTPRRRGGVLRTAWEWAKSLSIAFVLFLLVRSLLVEAFKIPSGSMEGTLLVGDFLLVNKLVYGAEVPFTGRKLPAVREPRVGDVVVFEYPIDRTKNYVKRLVGAPGDTLEMKGGVLIRNGVAQVEPYALHGGHGRDFMHPDFQWQRAFVVPSVDVRRYHPSRNDWGPLFVPADHYFVLGDNRDFSEDSRYWGFVPDSLMLGSPLLVYFSYSPDSSQTFDWLTGVRWRRLGDLIR
jgi:signal peptidase I